MTIRMRHTKSHTQNRRSHHFLRKATLSACGKCGELKFQHKVCKNCGNYGSRSVLDVLKKLTKKQKKTKEKELQEQEQVQTNKPLDAGNLSKK